MVDVSIIIVNYNTFEITLKCIDSIFEHVNCISYEIILVDNASIDGSKEYFEKCKNIKYIYSEVNKGFAYANNIGIRVAKGKYIFLLNSDTILLNNAILYFYEYAESHRDEVLVLGGFLEDNNGNIVCSSGNFPTIMSELKSAIRVYTKYLFNNYVDLKYMIYDNLNVDFVIGADMFLSKSICDKCGLLDETYFMYYEDSDWQKRMSRLGVVRMLIGGPKIIHIGGGSFEVNHFGKSSNKQLLVTESMFLYLRKNNYILLYLMFRCIYAILRFLPTLFNEYKWFEKIKYIKLLLKY